MFTLASQLHSHYTRNCNLYCLYYIPPCRTNIRNFSIRFQGPKFFNSLSHEIQNTERIRLFGKRLTPRSFWDQSGIRIIGIMRVSVCLGAILIPEHLDFHSGYSASRSRTAGIYSGIHSYSGISQTNAPLKSSFFLSPKILFVELLTSSFLSFSFLFLFQREPPLLPKNHFKPQDIVFTITLVLIFFQKSVYNGEKRNFCFQISWAPPS